MLLIQQLYIEWGKECRGAPYSTLRNNRQHAYMLPKNFFDYNPIGYPSHIYSLHQTKKGFSELVNRIYTRTKYEKVTLDCVEILKDENSYDIYVKYNPHMGNPVRTNKCRKTKTDFSTDHDNSIYGMLNELAMTLEINKYGRIRYNGRLTDYDTGSWYYAEEIINIINTVNEKENLDIFLKKQPDKMYEQIAILY